MELCNHNRCTGCGVCKAVCRHDAILWTYDELGFRYPFIDAKKCVDCGLCGKKCPSLSPVDFQDGNDCYIAWAKDDVTHFESSSGGIATLFGKHIIEQGGFVIGCMWDNDYNAIFSIIDDVNDLSQIQGSKYVQSYIPDELWAEIKSRVCKRQQGLFIGLPCQAAALIQFVGNHNDLIVIDLLCRGGCSPTCLKEHLSFLKKKNLRGEKITNLRFRGGSNDCRFTLWNKNKLVYQGSQFVDSYFYSFMKHGLLHESCYQCQYARKERVSDITLADFWGIDSNFIKDKNIMNGSNLVLVHTEIGRKIWEELGGLVERYERPLEEAVAGNDTLREPTEAPSDRDELLGLIKKYGFEKAVLHDKVLVKNKMRHKRRLIANRIETILPKPIVDYLKQIKQKYDYRLYNRRV